MICGTVTQQGFYTDNKGICEIYINRASSNKLPHQHGKKKLISVVIGGIIYEAGVHETADGTVWLSSVLYKNDPKRTKTRLVDALAKIGVEKGNTITMEANNDGSFTIRS